MWTIPYTDTAMVMALVRRMQPTPEQFISFMYTSLLYCFFGDKTIFLSKYCEMSANSLNPYPHMETGGVVVQGNANVSILINNNNRQD